MLGDKEVFATIPVKNLAQASEFYEQKLGLKRLKDYDGGVVYESGPSKVLVYESQHAGTNQGTAASWKVGDVEATVESLRQKGVTFEHYEMPGTELAGDVHIMGGEKAAWFKDPSGNILCVNTSETQ